MIFSVEGTSAGGVAENSAIMRFTPLSGVLQTSHSRVTNSLPRAADKNLSNSAGGRMSEKRPSAESNRKTPAAKSSNESDAVWRAVVRDASGESSESIK